MVYQKLQRRKLNFQPGPHSLVNGHQAKCRICNQQKDFQHANGTLIAATKKPIFQQVGKDSANKYAEEGQSPERKLERIPAAIEVSTGQDKQENATHGQRRGVAEVAGARPQRKDKNADRKGACKNP